MNHALSNNLSKPGLFAVFASVGIHLLAFSGLQAATRQTPSSQTPSSVDVVELSSDDIDRLPEFVQQQLNPNTANQSLALFPLLQTQPESLSNPNANLSPNATIDPQFYSSNYNSPYLDTFLNTLPPPPPGGGWFSGSSVPILTDPLVLPDPQLGSQQSSQQALPAPANLPAPPAGEAPAESSVQTSPQIQTQPQIPSASVPSASLPNPVDSIIEIPQEKPEVAARPQPNPTFLPSAISQIQALQEEYRDRYTYNPEGTSVEEAQALLTNLVAEIRSATGQTDLQPEAGIQVKLAFPDPVCPRSAHGIAIVVLVDAQGYLIESRLLRSSGYEVLDQLALDNVKQRTFTGQANGRYTLYQYLFSFADLDGICFTDQA